MATTNILFVIPNELDGTIPFATGGEGAGPSNYYQLNVTNNHPNTIDNSSDSTTIYASDQDSGMLGYPSQNYPMNTAEAWYSAQKKLVEHNIRQVQEQVRRDRTPVSPFPPAQPLPPPTHPQERSPSMMHFPITDGSQPPYPPGRMPRFEDSQLPWHPDPPEASLHPRFPPEYSHFASHSIAVANVYGAGSAEVTPAQGQNVRLRQDGLIIHTDLPGQHAASPQANPYISSPSMDMMSGHDVHPIRHQRTPSSGVYAQGAELSPSDVSGSSPTVTSPSVGRPRDGAMRQGYPVAQTSYGAPVMGEHTIHGNIVNPVRHWVGQESEVDVDADGEEDPDSLKMAPGTYGHAELGDPRKSGGRRVEFEGAEFDHDGVYDDAGNYVSQSHGSSLGSDGIRRLRATPTRTVRYTPYPSYGQSHSHSQPQQVQQSLPVLPPNDSYSYSLGLPSNGNHPNDASAPVLPPYPVQYEDSVHDEYGIRTRKVSSGTACSSSSASTSTSNSSSYPPLTPTSPVSPTLTYLPGTYPDGSGSNVESKRRARQATPLPVPIPVPNLTKKSRGRRVPTVAALQRGRSSDRTRGGSSMSDGAAAGSKASASRMYTCTVAGCGKCFARGEHLKRHVRSIHTYEKPHRCPYPGCEKDFSRHDNLGQHMRVHKDFVAPPKAPVFTGYRESRA
ncbi:Zf-C2H2 Zinc finger, C2H2 type [Pleurotus pulmonarius]